MPVTVLENIATTLKARLDVMTLGSFETDVSEVVRPAPNTDHTPKHLQVLIKQGTSERLPENDYPGNPPAVARRQIFELHLHIHDRGETDTEDTLANTFAADVQKAVATSSDWHTFGGYAFNAEFLDYELKEADGGTGGVTLPLAISYRTSELDPYTVR